MVCDAPWETYSFINPFRGRGVGECHVNRPVLTVVNNVLFQWTQYCPNSRPTTPSDPSH